MRQSEHGLTSPYEDVRHASCRTLLGEVDKQEVCDVLAANVGKSLRKQTVTPATCGMLGVLLASELEPIKAATTELLSLAAKQAAGNTWTYDALVAALAYNAEAIYFLTDGEPCGGTLSEPISIVAAMTALNRSRRVTINTIGVGAGWSARRSTCF